MSKFTIHTVESAPEQSKKLLKKAIKKFDMIPNLYGVLAESPNLLEAYDVLGKLFQTSSFNNDELTVVWQTINVEHDCTYCVPGHTAIANMMGVDEAITEALRNESPLPSPKLEVLRETTLAIVRGRGRITEAETEKFYGAGYEQRQMLEIILGLSQKVISNYVNHIAQTTVDAPFMNFEWHKKK